MRGPIGIFVTALVVVGQIATLGLCFIGGNYVSLIFDNDRATRLDRMISAEGWDAVDLGRLPDLLRPDAVSCGYTAFAAIMIIRSYGKTTRRRTLGSLVALPATILLVFVIGFGVLVLIGLGITMLIYLVTLLGDEHRFPTGAFASTLPLVIGGSVCLAYWAVCQAAVALRYEFGEALHVCQATGGRWSSCDSRTSLVPIAAEA